MMQIAGWAIGVEVLGSYIYDSVINPKIVSYQNNLLLKKEMKDPIITSIIYSVFTMYILQGNKLQIPAVVGGVEFLMSRPASVDPRGHGAIQASGCTQDGFTYTYFKKILLI